MPETLKPNPEQFTTHEEVAMGTLDTTAKRIFISYIANRENFDVSSSKDHQRVTSKTTGASIARSTNPEGATSYELTSPWSTDTDSGNDTFRWDPTIPKIHHEYDSEAQGKLGEKQGSGVTMEYANDMLERNFPVRVEVMPSATKTPFERIMGRLILRRAKKATAPVIIER